MTCVRPARWSRGIVLLCAVAGVTGSWLAHAQERPPAADTPPRSFDLGAIDKSVDPCVDFYEHACGAWRRAHPVPANRPRWGRSDEVTEHNQRVLRGILEEAARGGPARTAIEAKVGDFYASCMDQGEIDARGLRPIDEALALVAATRSKPELVATLGRLRQEGLDLLFQFLAVPALNDAKRTVAEIDQGGTSLPDRGYYLKPDARMQETRERFAAYVATLLRLAGDPPEVAATRARDVLAFETSLATAQLDSVQRRDPKSRDHLVRRADLRALAPAFDLEAYFSAAQAPAFTELNVGWPEFFKGLDAAWRETAFEKLQTYVRWRLLHASVTFLPSAFEQANFDFASGSLRGVKEPQPRWQRCVAATDRALGEALGRLYVERTFGADGKATMRRLVQSLVDALEQDIAGLDWMTAPTRQRALEKLRLLDTSKIGYPDVWRDYTSVRIARDDYAGNRRRVARFDTRRAFDAVGKPVDQREWLLSPPSVNAYYHPQLNEIVFPAGILQPPFFDRRVDKAVNLGAIGSVIGHELTHGFDDEGRAFDGAGNLSDWWTDADARAFQERASCLGRQYSGYSPVKDPRTGEPVYLNPDLTMGENIGDNGGVRIAYLALENTLENGSAEVVEGYTPEQRFFLGFAQISCQNMTDAEVLRRIATDPHSANRFRVNGPLRNLPEFQKAFGCATGTPMAPADRCRVW